VSDVTLQQAAAVHDNQAAYVCNVAVVGCWTNKKKNLERLLVPIDLAEHCP
jgi:hypothetical protein